MTIAELKEQGFAERKDLKPYIERTVSFGRNEWGFEEKTIVLTDRSCWDWIPEDQLYEYNPNKRMDIS